MLITILTTGTRGDTQPYIALGVQLKKQGYRVRIAAFEIFEKLVLDHGLEFFPIQGDLTFVTNGKDAQEAMMADNPIKVISSFKKLKKYIFELQNDFFQACVGASLIIYHPGAPIGYFSAQYFGVPSILATPFPMTPTREYPSIIVYDKIHLGGFVNFKTHKIFENIMWSTSSAAVKYYWKEKFGKLPENFTNPYPKQISKENPTLISCSNHVFSRPDDWPEGIICTGYWFLENYEDWSPPCDLHEFLDKGVPPVYIGFGSMSNILAAEQTTQIIKTALEESNQRGLLARGWSDLFRVQDQPNRYFMIDSVPHEWLFPKMNALVHHGGAGTTAAGLRSGVPQIIIPHSNDQFAWARRMKELGVAADPIPIKKLNVEKLIEAIHFVQTEKIRSQAREYGEKIRSEKGAKKIAHLISDWFGL